MNFRNYRGWKVLTGVLCFALVSIAASGCTLSQNNVKLHTEAEMQSIVEERYGEAELISVEDEKDSNRKRIFTYRDKKYGFTYQMTSYPSSVGIDGAVLYYDGAGIRFGYEEPFLAYFMEQEKANFAEQGITLCDALTVSNSYETDRMFSVKSKLLVSTSDKWEDDMQFAWDRVHAYTAVPETTMGYQLNVYNSRTIEFYGTLQGDGFVTAEAQRIDYYMNQARDLGGIQDIQYLRTERKRISEVPGLSEQNFYDQSILDNDRKVNVYYFSYEGEEYFIVDVWVAQKLEEEGITPIFQYYQNYKHYDISRH